MSFLTVYFLIGLCIMFTIQYVNDKFIHKNDATYFNFFEALLGILLWPILVLLFIKALKHPPRD